MYRCWIVALTFGLVAMCFTMDSQAYNPYYNGESVGGVMVDAEGILAQVPAADMKEIIQVRQDALQPVQKELQKSGQRAISLTRLSDAMAACAASNSVIPDSVRLLGGLTAIEYVFIDKEAGDVVLVGPAEAWKMGPQGVLVGKDSGKPILQLEDLLVALQGTTSAARSVFSVSIDPTPEGLQRSREYTSSLKQARNPKVIARTMEEKLGDQVVTFQGIEPTSHFAVVMAAADYRMKQISMGATKSPLKSLPSFVSMVKNAKEISGSLPRWWLAPNYDGMTRSEDGLSWNLGAGKVVTMTETDVFDGKQVQRNAGKSHDVFTKWADKMTENYEELSVVEPIFGQLKACMDCAMAAAIVADSGIAFDSLMNHSELYTKFTAPKSVPSTAVVAKKGAGFLFTNGGVSIDMWKAVQSAKVADLADQRMTVDGKNWWK